MNRRLKPFLLTITSVTIATVASSNVLASAETDSMFTAFDSDKNNQLSLQEFKNGGMDSEGDSWSEGLSTVCTTKSLKMVEPELIKTFELMDDNKDKKLSRDEFNKKGETVYNDYWNTSFKQADSDKNNMLSMKEYKKQASGYIERLKESYQDKNIPVECKADMEYWQGYYSEANKYVDESFQYLDHNNDKKLSFDEYVGKHFK